MNQQTTALNTYEVEFLSAINKFFFRTYLAANILEAAQYAQRLATDVKADVISINLIDG